MVKRRDKLVLLGWRLALHFVSRPRRDVEGKARPEGLNPRPLPADRGATPIRTHSNLKKHMGINLTQLESLYLVLENCKTFMD